jgi:hypothetical protein
MKRKLSTGLAAVFCVGLLSATVPSGNSIAVPLPSNVKTLLGFKERSDVNARTKQVLTKENKLRDTRFSFTKEEFKKQHASKKINIIKGAKVDSDKAMFVMEVGEGLGSALQVLFFDQDKIDETEESFYELSYTFLDSSTSEIDRLYEEALVKVPANAVRTMSDTSKGIGSHSTVLTEITPGSYDMVILEIDSTYWYSELLAQGTTLKGAVPSYIFDNTVLDGIDFTFEAGYVYHLVYDYSSMNPLSYYKPYKALPSVAVSSIDVARSSMTLSATEPMGITVENTGVVPLSGLDFYMSVDGGDVVKETMPLTDTVNPFKSYKYSFTATADLSADGVHTIKVWIDSVEGDGYREDDTLSVKRLHAFPIDSYPFYDPLDEDLLNWNIVNLNGGSEWEAYSGNTIDADGKEDGWAAVYEYDTKNGDDYLVSLSPFVMKKDSSYRIEFMVASSGYVEYPEKFSVYYGTSADPVQMMEIWSEKEIMSGLYIKAIANIDSVPADGDYYIAIKAASNTDMYVLMIDNIKVDKGTVSAKADVSVTDILFDIYPACELPADGSATAMLFNKGEYCNTGDGNANDVTLKYKFNNGAEQTTKVSGAVPVGIVVESVIDGLDLSKQDSNTLAVYLSDESEAVTAAISVVAPVASFPVVYDFTILEDITEFGPASSNSWIINEFFGVLLGWRAIDLNAPLVSRCFTLKSGVKYDVNYGYITGLDEPQDFYLAVGSAGTDWTTWTKISEKLESHEDEIIIASESFTVPADGNYQFAFVGTKGDYLEITSFELSLTAGSANEDPAVAAAFVKATPNPVKEFVTLSSHGASIEDVVITNAMGNNVYSAKNINAPSVRVNTASFAQGIYFARIKTANGTKTVKFMAVR